MPLEMLHLTLVFLGATDPARVTPISTTLDSVAARHGPIGVRSGAAGGRTDDRRGGVAWLGLVGGREALARLSLELDRSIGSAVYASMAPQPHLTVARRIDQALLDDLRRVAGEVRLEWLVDHIVLFRSHTGPHGSRYEELDRRPLTPAKTSA